MYNSLVVGSQGIYLLKLSKVSRKRDLHAKYIMALKLKLIEDTLTKTKLHHDMKHKTHSLSQNYYLVTCVHDITLRLGIHVTQIDDIMVLKTFVGT